MKRIHLRILFSLVGTLFILQSCKSIQMRKTFTSGKVVEQQFSGEIPFDNYLNQLFVPIQISGKTYHFIFDTGNSLTAIDKSLLSEIEFTSNGVSGKSVDASKVQVRNDFIEISNIQVGDIHFANTGAQVLDLSHFSEIMGCIKMDGVLGTNFMRKCNWQIDYAKKVIRYSNSVASFQVSDSVKMFPILSKKRGGVTTQVEIAGVKSSFKFDTGSSFNISANTKLFDQITTKKKTSSIPKNGLLSYNAYSKDIGQSHIANIDSLKIGKFNFENQQIEFKNKSSNLIGNQFLKNFSVTIDWTNNSFILDPVKSCSIDSLFVFPLTCSAFFGDTSIRVLNYLGEKNPTYDRLLQAKVKSINGLKTTFKDKESLCLFWEKQGLEFKEMVELELILEIDGKLEMYRFEKKVYLPK